MSSLLQGDNDVEFSIALTGSGSLGLVRSKQRKCLSFEAWTDAFNVYASVYRLRYPECTEPLSTYHSVIRNIYAAGGELVLL